MIIIPELRVKLVNINVNVFPVTRISSARVRQGMSDVRNVLDIV